jgi:hypothetical protein
VNLIQSNDELEIRVPATDFKYSRQGKPNVEIHQLRTALKESGVEFSETNGMVVTFTIDTRKYRAVTWINATSHGFRVLDGNKFLVEVIVDRVTDQIDYIVNSTIAPVKEMLVMGNTPFAPLLPA